MHLKYDEKFNSFVFFSSILFLAIMFVLTLADLGTRGLVDPELDNFAIRRDQAAQLRMDEAAAAAAAAAPAPAEGGASGAPAPEGAAPAQGAPAPQGAPVPQGAAPVAPTPSPSP